MDQANRLSQPELTYPPALPGFLSVFDRIGVDQADLPETRLQKSLLAASTAMMATLGIFWGAIYFSFGEVTAASIPLCYSAISFISLAQFAVFRRYHLFAASQLLASLLLPFFLMLSLGNFVQSSGVILWSLASPLGALLFTSRRQAIWWFAAFGVMLVISAALTPYLRVANSLPSDIIRMFFLLNIGGVSAFAFVLTYYFVSRNKAMIFSLDTERNRSEALLLNVLPKDIADQLKQGPQRIASQHASASVLFADIVGFTERTHRTGPDETVDFLNRIHSHFDDLVDRHGLEKIRTIGDSYMVASGIPRFRADHAHALARLALDMLVFASANEDGEDKLSLRIGIASGPLIAGVIGRKKFCYDVWGDTVNMASRMESTGSPGKIQISEETFEAIKESFRCEGRGSNPIKGRGLIKSWWLIGST